MTKIEDYLSRSYFYEIRDREKHIKCDNNSLSSVFLIFAYPSQALISETSRKEQLFKDQFKELLLAGEDNESTSLESLERKLVNIKKVLEDEKVKKNQDSNKFYQKQHDDLVQEISKFQETSVLRSIHDKYPYLTLQNNIRKNIIYFLLYQSTFIEKNGVRINFFNSVPDYARTFWQNKLFTEFMIFYYGYSVDIMRAIARSSFVMNIWQTACSSGSPIFRGPISEYTQVQLNLCFWLKYYSDVFKNIGTPPKNYFDDDKLFDEWVKKQIEDMKNPKKDGGKGRNSSDNSHKVIFGKPKRAVSSKKKK